MFMAALLAVYVAKQVLVAVLFPPFTGHDEVAHYEYVRILALEWRLPTLHKDVLPGRMFAYKDFALQWEESARWTTPLYTAVHPPLYYAAMVPAYRAGQQLSPIGKHYLLRIAAIPFGLLTVLLAFALGRVLFPDDAFIGVTVPTLVAFQPQVSYEASMVNNDIVAIALFSALLYVLVLVLRDGPSHGRTLWTGVLFGLCLLAKTSLAVALPLVVAAFWFSGTQPVVRRLVAVLLVGAVAALLVVPWYWFMVRTYGDLTGLGTLSAMQPDLTRKHVGFLQVFFSGEFAMARWRETWGEFGWRLIPVNAAVVTVSAITAVLALLGLLSYLVSPPEHGRPWFSPFQRNALLLLASACVLLYLAVVQFGTIFMLAQARYYFPVVNAAALLGMLGLRAWIPPHRRSVAAVSLVFCAIVATLFIYTASVVPYWYFR